MKKVTKQEIRAAIKANDNTCVTVATTYGRELCRIKLPRVVGGVEYKLTPQEVEADWKYVMKEYGRDCFVWQESPFGNRENNVQFEEGWGE